MTVVRCTETQMHVVVVVRDYARDPNSAMIDCYLGRGYGMNGPWLRPTICTEALPHRLWYSLSHMAEQPARARSAY
ncbi:hypothetical protein L915_17759 [Phytophthora nicotianae]|uniref:Uncharacterized protein n=2 Tax=Phytophthora nicotianae TaxID=4792 RepID=W2G044_PHYNI|nr:hypothetical protein L915_17759 [Phytophthora nicotianae]